MLKHMPESQIRFTSRLMAHHEQFMFIYVGYTNNSYHREKSGQDAPSKRRLAKNFIHRCIHNLKDWDIWTMNLILEWYGLEYEARVNDGGNLKVYSKGEGIEV